MALLNTSLGFTFTVLTFLQSLLITQPSKEYQVKAVFLFNFTQFVEWPTDSFQDPTSPLVICIIGEDPFGSYLEKIIDGEKVAQHPLTIKHVSSIEEIKDSHILFINTTGNQMKEILSSVKGQHILTVSDANNFAKNGGVIRMYTEERKIKIRINLTAAKANQLTISSKLLRIADIVE